jgi:hypothetical protein
LWTLGEYYELSYLDAAGNAWTSVPFIGSGANIIKDPTRSGTVWACSGYQALRTDGNYNYSKVLDDFQELDPQSDVLSTVIPAPDGIAWVGSNQGLFRLNANDDSYQFFYPGNSEIPGENITPLGYTPDGRLWFTNFGSTATTEIGLCWFDGSEFGVFPVQDAGLPHAQIADLEVKEHQNGYELWMSCLSRGIAVLDVTANYVGIAEKNVTESVLFLQNYPNPFKDETSISFSLPHDGFVSLSIYDINGRIVRHLADTFYLSGTYSLTWDGDDSQGTRVNPGIYLCRIIDGNQTKSIRIIVQ